MALSNKAVEMLGRALGRQVAAEINEALGGAPVEVAAKVEEKLAPLVKEKPAKVVKTEAPPKPTKKKSK